MPRKALLRCAFYAGAVAVLHVRTYPGRDGKAPGEAEMEARMAALSEEVKQFTDAMAKGRGRPAIGGKPPARRVHHAWPAGLRILLYIH